MGNFLLGFGIGLAVGVLFAPQAGPETREFLANKAGEGSDYLMQQGKELRDKSSDLLEKGKNAVMQQKDRVTGAAEQGYQQGRESYQRS